jgi:hypothetical protein
VPRPVAWQFLYSAQALHGRTIASELRRRIRPVQSGARVRSSAGGCGARRLAAPFPHQ